MTEDVENIFEGPSFPYLRSTDCDYERQGEKSLKDVQELKSVKLDENDVASLTPVFSSPMPNILGVSSALFRWHTRISKEKLEKRLNEFYPIGDLVDILPRKRGISERVVELTILGAESQADVRGFKIRRVLGLRETLFVIDREYDKEGNIAHFNFLGKGLGHGVGLCQVGAFGMARSGADYKEILKKYYQGITISKIY
jgi:stage II sporulation protein D